MSSEAAPGAMAGLRVIDLTRYMCSARRCYAVVGNALVHKDKGHLTQVYATTLGPYLRPILVRALSTR